MGRIMLTLIPLVRMRLPQTRLDPAGITLPCRGSQRSCFVSLIGEQKSKDSIAWRANRGDIRSEHRSLIDLA
jgi:hypothetical protein